MQAQSLVPKLEKELEKARLEWAKLLKDRSTLATDVKKMSNPEVDVVELEKRIIHQEELERKDAFVRRICKLLTTPSYLSCMLSSSRRDTRRVMQWLNMLRRKYATHLQ